MALVPDDADSIGGATHNTDQYTWFGATSAAAPLVSGQIALFRGYMQRNGRAYAREDVEGVLKASAHDVVTVNPPFDLDPYSTHPAYPIGYDTLTGFGFVQADTMFMMLDPTRKAYVLAHIEVPDSALHFGIWSLGIDSNKLFYDATSDTSVHEHVPSSKYNVRVREITATYSYAPWGFDTTKKLYVWGNTGLDSAHFHHRGRAKMYPNWQEPWCEVTSGQQGFGMPGDTSFTPGIEHKYLKTVTLHTWQYGICDGTGTITSVTPDSADIGLGFTVFGVLLGSSGVQRYQAQNGSFAVWPSIASNRIEIDVENSVNPRKFELIDLIGRPVFEQILQSGTRSFDVATNRFSSGFYIGRLTTDVGIEEARIIVHH